MNFLFFFSLLKYSCFVYHVISGQYVVFVWQEALATRHVH